MPGLPRAFVKAAFLASILVALVATPLCAVTLSTQLVTADLSSPVLVTAAPGDNTRLFVVEQGGFIRIIRNGGLLERPFLNLADSITCCGERGLLGLAFHPDYQSNGLFYVNYTAPGGGAAGRTRVARLQVSPDADSADYSSQLTVIEIEQPVSNHNGGMLAFGPLDGYLYIGMGDGGGAGDTGNRAQTASVLLGKMLRIDVDHPDAGLNYGIPDDNPFVGAADTLPEIWAFGLRNPWRWSFDRVTGDMWIGDVGQGMYEEIDFQSASSAGGENYGWRCREGAHDFNTSGDCDLSFTEPFSEYNHVLGRQAITGGYVYRGCAIPELTGTYLYADYATGEVWSLRYDGSTVSDSTDRTAEIGLQGDQISSFGEDNQGELYVVKYAAAPHGAVYKIVPIGVPACESSCCSGRVGDPNQTGGDEPTIGDVGVMIDALFITGAPDPISCFEEADVNQSGGTQPVFDDITIGDISILIDYLFVTGPVLGLYYCL